MQRALEKLRSRSDEEKRALATFVSIGVVVVLFVVWSTATMASFAQGNNSQSASATEAERVVNWDVFSPVTNAFGGVSGAYEEGVAELRRIQGASDTSYTRESETGTVVPVGN